MNTKVHPPERMRRWALIGGLCLLLGCGAADPLSPEPSAQTARQHLGSGTYEQVTDFGPNPGALNMYRYIPPDMPAQPAPLVLALHGCTVNAATYRKAGWEEIADVNKFYVAYPEQTPANNPQTCFTWEGGYGDPANMLRGHGENQSIIDMVDKMKADFSIDPARIFITGHSAGGAMTMLMLAVWPDVFAAGGVIAGIPYQCAHTLSDAYTCISPGISKTDQQWGDLARQGYPGFAGPYPRLSSWQGTADTVVDFMNLGEILKQWTNLVGIDMSPDVQDQVANYPHRQYQDANGSTLIEQYELTGVNHGIFVDPTNHCGSVGSYVIDAHICSSYYIGKFFGLIAGAGGSGGSGGAAGSGSGGAAAGSGGVAGSGGMLPTGGTGGSGLSGSGGTTASGPDGGNEYHAVGDDSACSASSRGATQSSAPALLGLLIALTGLRRRGCNSH